MAGRIFLWCLAVSLITCADAQAQGDSLLWGFEHPLAPRSLHVTKGDRAEIVEKHARGGAHSLHITMPAYKAGVRLWRTVRLLLPPKAPKNWSGYRYIEVDVYNPMPDAQLFGIRPMTHGTRSLYYVVPPKRWTTLKWRLSTFAGQSPDHLSKVSGVIIQVMLHIKALTYPTQFYVDNIRLVSKTLSDKQALTITVLQPKGSRIYTSDPIKKAEFGVTLDVPKKTRADLTGQVRVVNAAGAVLKRAALRTNTSALQRFSIKLRDKSDLTVAATVTDTRSGKSHTTRKRIVFMPPSKSQVIVDSENRLLVNGKPMFPLGVFFSGPTLGELKYVKELGFNCIGPYISPTSTLMQQAQHLGLRVLAFCPHGKTPNGITPLSKSPALLGYYLFDEPHTYTIPPEQIRQVVDKFAARDPYHPTVVLCNSEYQVYAGLGDVHMVDSYGLPGRFNRLVGRMTSSIKANLRYGPVWLVPQIFTKYDYGRSSSWKRSRPLTYDELRSETWMGIALGATGIFYYNYWTSLPDSVQRISHPDVWKALGHVNDEVLACSSALLSDREIPLVVKGPKLFRARCKVFGKDKLLIIAVNGSQKPTDATIKIKSAKSRELRVVGEDRTVKLRAGVLKDHFGAQETHLYTSDARLAKAVNVVAYRRENQRSREKRGALIARDLAQASHGTKLTASWGFPVKGQKDKFGYCRATPWIMMIDGNRGTKWTIGDDGWYHRYKWPAKLIFKGRRWLNVELGKSVRGGVADIVTSKNLQYQLMCKVSGKWIKLKRVSSTLNDTYHYRIIAKINKFDIPRKSIRTLRLLFTKDTPRKAAIFEIEVFRHSHG